MCLLCVCTQSFEHMVISGGGKADTSSRRRSVAQISAEFFGRKGQIMRLRQFFEDWDRSPPHESSSSTKIPISRSAKIISHANSVLVVQFVFVGASNS